jgi:hypothetical protein
MLHAAAFAIRGIRILSLREVLFAFSLLFVAAFYAAALHFGGAIRAGAVACIALAWSLPNHFSSMPSWYNLFFATLATLALLRHDETGLGRWSVLAGIFVGLAVLVKLHGLFLLAAGLLIIIHREEATLPDVAGRHSNGFFAVKTAALVLAIVARRPAPMELLHFVLPGAALSYGLGVREWREGHGDASFRIRRVAAMSAPFLLGTAIPIAAFLVPYRGPWRTSYGECFSAGTHV